MHIHPRLAWLPHTEDAALGGDTAFSSGFQRLTAGSGSASEQVHARGATCIGWRHSRPDAQRVPEPDQWTARPGTGYTTQNPPSGSSARLTRFAAHEAARCHPARRSEQKPYPPSSHTSILGMGIPSHYQFLKCRPALGRRATVGHFTLSSGRHGSPSTRQNDPLPSGWPRCAKLRDASASAASDCLCRPTS